MDHLIAPSILTADFGNLSKVIELINNSEADWFHLDVMDGVFVPNISFGLPVISSIKKLAKKPLDVHLMIVNPEKYIEQFKEAGADKVKTQEIRKELNKKKEKREKMKEKRKKMLK